MSEAPQRGRITLPNTTTSEGTMRNLLAENLGREVLAEFLVGMDTIERKSGILYAVSDEYIVLYDDVNLVDIVCDRYSLRFISFYLPGARPGLNEPMPIPSADAKSSRPIPASAVLAARARQPTQAAFHYARSKAQKLE
ncbi:MAG: hypothetical protein RSC91_11445 [Clostridia bacterium]